MSLREQVRVKTATTDLKGVLYVGKDGLPELRVDTQLDGESFRPSTLPAAWGIRQRPHTTGGPLLEAWWAIERIRDEIIDAQREADTDDRDCAQQREIDNRTAMEIDERREDERIRASN